MKRAFLFLFFLQAAAIFLPAQGRFRQYTTEDGLPQNSVFAITQDKQGFLWFGTQDGLARYDGYSFVSYKPDPADSSSLPGNSVKCMLCDKAGNLWVGTRTGLCRYNAGKNNFDRFPALQDSTRGPASDVILALAEDKDGNIWIATVDKGVSVYHPAQNRFTHFRHKEGDAASLCGDDVRGIATDARGHVWLVSWAHGVSEYDPATGKFSSISHAGGQMNYPNSRGAICADLQGRIWIGTWGRGFNVWDPVKRSMQFFSVGDNPDDPRGMIWSIVRDRKGRLWAATAETGLVRIDPATMQKKNFMNDPDDPQSLGDNNVWTVAEDRSGLIWVGTWQAGLSVLDEKLDRFMLLQNDPQNPNALPSPTVWSFCSDGAKGIWIGTGGGPVHYEPATGIFTQPPVSGNTDQAPSGRSIIQSLCRDVNGNIWMGSVGGGLYRYDPVVKKYNVYIPGTGPQAIRNSIISALLCDRQGNVWVAGGRELQRYDPAADNFIAYDYAPSDSVDYKDQVYVIAEQDADHLWLGLANGEVFLFDKKSGKLTKKWESPAGNISAFYPDRFGGLWIGTGSSGLFYLKDGKTTGFSERNGLPNNVINGIVPGNGDELWISTNRGVCMLNPLTREIRNYLAADGLQGNEFNQGACFRSGDGRIWFGGARGLNVFHPKDITPNTAPADAVITSFTVLNKNYPLPEYITQTKTITLSWRDYFFSFEFAGLEFSNPSRNHYRYMMEGFDQDWIEAGDRRFVTYTNLDPGEYTFRVKASNNDGNWDGKVVEIRIEITPPFWRTNWFYALCIITVVLGGWLYIRRRERKLRKEKEMLETKVRERTHELELEKEKVTEAHKDIRDSITYAKRIQYALLAHEDLLRENLQDFFVLFRPKDIVSGDFYWATRMENRFYLAVCDSTGHGVPGAFMSLLNISFLNEAIIEKRLQQPGEIFDHVRMRLIGHISQDGGKDGMDAILFCFDRDRNTVSYAASNNAPVIIRAGEIIQPDTDKMPVGKGEKTDAFRTFEIRLQAGDALYLYTDGFADQFGGPQGKKFREANLRKLLLQTASAGMTEQKEKLAAEFDSWKGELEQIDDMLILGLRIPG